MTQLSHHVQIVRPANKPIQTAGAPCACGDHVFAPIGRGFVTMVSPQDSALLRRKWNASIGTRAVQVISRKRKGEDRLSRLLSREIMRPMPGFVVDHINCDPTDNRRSNLRVCTQAENARNRRKERHGGDLPKGVFTRPWGRYYARITVDGHLYALGGYATKEEASAAYAAAARDLHGEFARVE